MDDKTDYVRNRILKGYTSHKLTKKAIKECKIENETKSFSIDRFEWKDLDKIR